jgi:hypothetical protein
MRYMATTLRILTTDVRTSARESTVRSCAEGFRKLAEARPGIRMQ